MTSQVAVGHASRARARRRVSCRTRRARRLTFERCVGAMRARNALAAVAGSARRTTHCQKSTTHGLASVRDR